MPDSIESCLRRSLASSPSLGVQTFLSYVDDPAAWPLLPDLFERVRSLTPADTKSSRHYRSIVRMGLTASTGIMTHVGFDMSDPLHSSIWDWIVETTESDNAQLAEATYLLCLLYTSPSPRDS